MTTCSNCEKGEMLGQEIDTDCRIRGCCNNPEPNVCVHGEDLDGSCNACSDITNNRFRIMPECVHSLIGQCSMCGPTRELPSEPENEALEAENESLKAKVKSNQEVFDKIFAKFNRLDAFNPEDILISIDEYMSEHIAYFDKIQLLEEKVKTLDNCLKRSAPY